MPRTPLEVEDTQIEEVDSDDEVVEIHQRTRLVDKVKVKVQEPSVWKCVCKWVSITSAVIIFVAILITLWVQYGEYIKRRVFPPSITAMGQVCRNGTGYTYLSQLDQEKMKTNTSIHINMTVPEKPLVFLFPQQPYEFHESCLNISTTLDCIKYIIYSM